MRLSIIVLLFAYLHVVEADEATSPRKIRLSIPTEMTRADIYFQRTVANPTAILVLCPGMNGNGSALLTPEWVAFAREHHLGLVALSFASSADDLQDGRGYYYPSRGAGNALLDGLREVFKQDLPLLLYGMSGGAHFTARFSEWKPARVISWCAYSAGWWDLPKGTPGPPGVVACGDEDVRYGASLGYFLQGRALGKPWTWVSIAKTGHQSSPILDEFVRAYFAAILDGKTSTPEWRDVDLKCALDEQTAKSRPTLACWLPNSATANLWLKIHQP